MAAAPRSATGPGAGPQAPLRGRIPGPGALRRRRRAELLAPPQPPPTDPAPPPAPPLSARSGEWEPRLLKGAWREGWGLPSRARHCWGVGPGRAAGGGGGAVRGREGPARCPAAAMNSLEQAEGECLGGAATATRGTRIRPGSPPAGAGLSGPRAGGAGPGRGLPGRRAARAVPGPRHHGRGARSRPRAPGCCGAAAARALSALRGAGNGLELLGWARLPREGGGGRAVSAGLLAAAGSRRLGAGRCSLPP